MHPKLKQVHLETTPDEMYAMIRTGDITEELFLQWFQVHMDAAWDAGEAYEKQFQ